MNNNLLNEIRSFQSMKLSAKQERIVEAAIRLFADKGYSNTSTAEIAKAAAVSEASIFKQYGTKDKLLLSLIVSHLKEFLPSMADEVIGQFAAEYTFEQFIAAFLRNRVAFGLENREILKVILKELMYNEEMRFELLPYLSSVIIPRLSHVIESFKERGELIDISTDRILKLLLTFIGGFLFSRFVWLNTEAVEEADIEDAVRFIMQGLRNP